MPKKEAFLGREPSKLADPNLISSKVHRKINRKAAKLNELTRDEKLLCALRKALAAHSGLPETLGTRYYISGENLYVTHRGGGVQTRKGEPTTYTARGRFKIGKICGKECSFQTAEFNVTYRDTVDDRGLPDVNYIDPTTIDLLPKMASIVPS